MRERSISVYFARDVLKHAVSQGLDVVGLLRQNRISPRLLQEDNARISIERFANLQVSTMLAMRDESLGYASQRMPIGSWSMMCHAVIGSDTLGQALHRYCRFFQLFEFGVRPHLEFSEGSVHIVAKPFDAAIPAPLYSADTVLFNSHRFSNWLVQESLPLQAVHMIGPLRGPASDYRHMFFAAPTLFDQADSRLTFSQALLNKRVTQNEQSLRHFLRHPVLIMLTQGYSQSSWTMQVKNIIRHNLEIMPELNEVATQLAIHPQTLRRRLSSEGTNFKEIKNQLRRDTALHFLGKQGLSIEEIAYRAGFSEASAFIRAFKGWTGLTPYTYRKGL